MHREEKICGMKFDENWNIVGKSDGKGDVPAFKLVAYKGHTLRGNNEGVFVYAKERMLPEAAVLAVREAALNAGLNVEEIIRIDNIW